jgi:DNA-binding transcriptional LysR family regulator
MDLRRLEVFVALAEEGSFSRAARRLGVTQPAVSLAIRAFEEELRVPLVSRRAKRAQVTAAGEVLLRYAQALTRMAKEAEDAVRIAGTKPAGRIHLGASSVPGNYVLPARLAAFRKKHPDVHVTVDITDSSDQIDRVRDRVVEMAAVGMQVTDRRLEFQRFAEDEVLLVAPPKSALDVPDALTPAELGRFPVLSREAGSATRQVVEDALAGSVPSPLVLGSQEAVKHAVLAGAGIAFLSRHAVTPELRRGELRVIDVTGLSIRRSLWLVRLQDRDPSPALVALRRFLLTE